MTEADSPARPSAEALAAQPPIFAERVRATVIAWNAGEPWFAGQPLAAGPHAHPGATELFVVLAGAFELSVGRERHTMREGDVFLIPPDAVHEPLGTAGTDLALVSIVSPNRKGLRFQTEGFSADSYLAEPGRAAAGEAHVPANAQLDGVKHVLAPGEQIAWEGRRDVDRVLLVLRGAVDVEIGPLGGRLEPGSMVFVPARAAHRAVGRGSEPAVLLAVWATGSEAAA